MSLQLGDTAPDFTAEITEGTINFYEFPGNSWGVLFLTSVLFQLL
jgi:alkyl hydroperoxide reductase subunit AhpC